MLSAQAFHALAFSKNCTTVLSFVPKRSGGWHNVPQENHLSLILLAIVHPDGNRAILSRALLDADFGPVGRNQHPARLRERTPR